jgi:hypothetical protein
MGLGAVVKPYEVVLATCNGATYLDEQLDSICGQTVPPQRVLVLDDASADDTLDLLQVWQRHAPLPIELLLQPRHRQGSCASFERLLAASRAPYVMPADQDDVWDRNKAERLLQAMDALERTWGYASPLLVHADLRLIDQGGSPLAPSFHRHQGLRPERSDGLSIAMQNVVTGCACLVNRACIEQALPFPPEVVLHDWWLAQVAAHQGAIGYLPAACVSYRQHATNVVGAVGWRRQLVRRLQELGSADTLAELAEARIGPGLRQLRACHKRFSPDALDGAGEHQRRRIEQLWSASPWRRLRAALALGLRKHGIWRTLGFYAALLQWQPHKQDG